MNLQKLLSYTRKAIDKYYMIEEGDKIAVGVSGGKDSLSLLLALHGLKRFYPKNFDIEAITVSIGLPDTDFTEVSNLCSDLGINYTVCQTDIAEIVFEERKEKNPCSLCSKMKKGALNEKAVELGCNKIALGHNKDDSIQTFFMSLFYEGRINCFSPVSYLDRRDIHTIRPLILVPEKDIISFAKKNKLPIVVSTCPANGNTKREETKHFVADMRTKYANFDNKIIGALERGNISNWKF